MKARRRGPIGWVVALIIVAGLLHPAGVRASAEAGTQTGVVATIPVNASPSGMDFNPVTNKIYVAHRSYYAGISVIDASTNLVQTVIMPPGLLSLPFDVAVNPITNRVYAVDQFSRKLYVIDGLSDAVTGVVTLPEAGWGVATDPIRDLVYVTSASANVVMILSGSGGVIGVIPVAAGPKGVVVDPETHRVYVANSGYNYIKYQVLNLLTIIENGAVTGTVTVGAGPTEVAIDAESRRVYVTNKDARPATVSVVNPDAGTEITQLAVGSTPIGIAVDPGAHRAYVANSTAHTLSVIDTETDTVIGTAPVGGTTPVGVAVDTVAHRAYVSNVVSRTVTVLQATTVLDYAPLLKFHPDEQYFPMDQADFIASSSLSWSHDRTCPDSEHADVGEVDAAMLGSGGYQDQEASDWRCNEEGTSYGSEEHTRPHDSPKANPSSNEGFFLDLEDERHAGHPGFPGSKPRLYYSYEPGRYITYWLFSGYNEPGDDRVGVFDRHEGDWERVSVRLDQNERPVAVAYYQHYCTPEIYTWDQLVKANAVFGGTHPIVYVANGSHASFPTAQEFDVEGLPDRGDLEDAVPCEQPMGWMDHMPAVDDTADGGVQWRTWEGGRLADIESQPWYGYGGAWGNNQVAGWMTGPLGPPHKADTAPVGWDAPHEPEGTAPAPGTRVYAALGDSYSSGEGAPPFDSTTANEVNKCHRSTRAYGQIVADELNRRSRASTALVFRACSGAKIANVLTSEQYPLERRQIDWLGAASLVTISIGGNDAGFGRVLLACANPVTDCIDHFTSGGRDEIDDLIDGLVGRLAGVYAAIRAAALPGAQIVVVGYPQMFPASPDSNCWGISPAEQTWIRGKAARLNVRIRSAMEQAGRGFTFVDTSRTFSGHDVCSDSPYVNGITHPIEFSFHPNVAGQRALASAVLRAVA